MAARPVLALVAAVLLLLLPASALAGLAPPIPRGVGPAPPAGAACSIPCGYIYPLIIIAVENGGDVRPLAPGRPLTVPATLTFRFDVMNEGFTIPNPNEPIILTFEFPRKPDWVDVAVEPARMEIPIQPQYIQPDATDPSNLKAYYVYTTEISIAIALTGQAVLKDGYEFAKLLVFAKSSESGLYKAGYGIKEFKVAPEGALHESDLAPEAPKVVVDLPPARLAPATLASPGLSVTLTPPAEEVAAWQPATFALQVADGAGSPMDAIVSATLLDESGAVAYNSGPRKASGGALALNVTLPGPGRHTLATMVEPAVGADATFVPRVVPFPIVVGPDSGDAVRMPREFVAAWHEVVTDVRGNHEEPAFQFEKVMPFPAAPASSGVGVTIALRSAAAPALPTGPGNLAVTMYDPEGAVLMQGTVDAANPTKSFPVGALPGSGWFELRVAGVGVPDVTAFDVRITVNYDDHPIVDRVTDGTLDDTTGSTRLGRVNATLDVADGTPFLAPWTPAVLSAQLERDAKPFTATVQYAMTAAAAGTPGASGAGFADGTIAYASGLREGAGAFGGSFTPPAPGRYAAFLHVAPSGPGPAFEPFTIARAFTVGDPTAPEIPAFESLTMSDEGHYRGPLPTETPLAEYLLPAGVADAGATVTLNGGPTSAIGASSASFAIVDAEGRSADLGAGGPRWLRAIAKSVEPFPVVVTEATFAPASPLDAVANPAFQGGTNAEPAKSFLPAAGAALAAVAVAAVALAARRLRP